MTYMFFKNRAWSEALHYFTHATSSKTTGALLRARKLLFTLTIIFKVQKSGAG